MPFQGNFIFGDLEETYETAMSTIHWWKTHPQYSINLHWIVVYPGSYLYQIACERGIIKDKAQFIKDGCPDINVSKMTASERKAVAAMINTAFQDGERCIQNAVFLREKSGNVTIKGDCVYCGASAVWQNLSVFHWQRDEYCSNCNHRLPIRPFHYIDMNIFDRNVRALLSRWGELAVWPVVAGVPEMLESSAALSEEAVHLVDSSEDKQGLEFHGKRVEAPKIIDEKQIETVVLAATTAAASNIVKIIETDYPAVKRILHVSALIFEDALIDGGSYIKHISNK
jgi:hypothetical protein